ncbi:fimbrial protein [Pantoea agglomerans]|uniref:fimbrial protein n=1 Tax=Enterobacter agglomerans TaxID=549 RepID=UPI00165462EE|nr:fimbrial protein [Pantoea agglomerans]
MNVTTRKNVFVLSALMLAICSSAAFATEGDPVPPTAPKAVTVNGGSVHFTGAIVDAACAVDTGSDGQTVKLGQYRAANLAKAGAASAKVPFTIKLTDCDLGGSKTAGAYSKVSVTFSGATAEGNNKALAVKAAQGGVSNPSAQNVGVEIFQKDTALTLDGTVPAAADNLMTGDNELNFSAAYVATADKATAGEADADVNFMLTYE